MDSQAVEDNVIKETDKIEIDSKYEFSKKSKRRKTERSHKYAILPSQVINVIGESNGISNLPENVLSGLAEDATYKLRELIGNCATTLKNQRRRKLLTEDVTRVLETADVGRIYGHSAPEECRFKFIEGAGIFVQEDHPVDIVELALKELTFTQKKIQSVSGLRVVVDALDVRRERPRYSQEAGCSTKPGAGVANISNTSNPGNDVENPPNPGTSAVNSPIPGTSAVNSPIPETIAGNRPIPGTSTGNTPLPGTSAGNSPIPGPSAGSTPNPQQERPNRPVMRTSEGSKHSQELLNYYIQIARAVLGGSSSILKVALEDLKTNPRAGPVCPYFFNFIALSINKLPRDEWLTNSLLSTVQSIVENPFLDPSSYLAAKRTINSLLVIAIEPKIAPNCDDLILRTRAAQLLSKVLVSWNIEMKVQMNIVRQLMQLLLDRKISLQTQFGAIYSLIALGHFQLSSHFWPVIGRYIPILEEREKPTLTSLAVHVGGCILWAADKMYRAERTNEATSEEWKRKQKVDYMLFDFFGDKLTPCRQDFDREGPVYLKVNSSADETLPTEDDDLPYKLSSVKSEPVDHDNKNFLITSNTVKKKCIIFKFEHSRQIETKHNRKVCSIPTQPYIKSPNSFRSIWYRQTLYKNTRTIKYCTKLHLKSSAGDLILSI